MEDKRLAATARLLEIMDTLRRECPWDREQTFDSLRSNTIEETYELADALLDHNMEGIKEELGDLLLHVVFYSKLGEEQQAFDYAQVVDALCDKLIYRHPHIYGDIHAATPVAVKENWEALKLRKKNRKSGTLGGVPRSLPAMVKAFRIGEKAAATGFDWEKREDVWAKVKEELGEVEAEMAGTADGRRTNSATCSSRSSMPAGSTESIRRRRLSGRTGSSSAASTTWKSVLWQRDIRCMNFRSNGWRSSGRRPNAPKNRRRVRYGGTAGNGPDRRPETPAVPERRADAWYGAAAMRRGSRTEPGARRPQKRNS